MENVPGGRCSNWICGGGLGAGGGTGADGEGSGASLLISEKSMISTSSSGFREKSVVNSDVTKLWVGFGTGVVARGEGGGAALLRHESSCMTGSGAGGSLMDGARTGGAGWKPKPRSEGARGRPKESGRDDDAAVSKRGRSKGEIGRAHV